MVQDTYNNNKNVETAVLLARLDERLQNVQNEQASLREKLADWYVQAEGLKHTRNRTMTALSRGQTPGPESSIGKVHQGALNKRIQQIAVDLLGPAAYYARNLSGLFSLEAWGGEPPLTWQLESGELPPGLGLDDATGEITGTPIFPVGSVSAASLATASGSAA